MDRQLDTVNLPLRTGLFIRFTKGNSWFFPKSIRATCCGRWRAYGTRPRSRGFH